ncbi:MAG: DUF4339 domain-containing protein [Verrucomicrobia bacterium]|nr:DUF4339 domain-containing protein [Verrucomicrobiota bacterium]
MEQRWFVRVSGREYGPVDLDTLAEWKREGRLVPSNDVRAEHESAWSPAAELAGLFKPPPLPPPQASAQPLPRHRTIGQIIRDSFRIYKSAFLPFFAATLLTAIPLLAFELVSPSYGIFRRGLSGSGFTAANITLLLAATVLIVTWPLFLAAIQIGTVEVLAGRKVRLGELLRRAVNYYPRFAWLSFIVYGSYFIWTALPVLAIVSLVSSGPSIATLLLALLILAIQVTMVARLWVNFLFWQQAAGIANLDGAAAIEESRALARSQRRARKIDRPLWRGALLASLWFVLMLGLSAGLEVPFVLSKVQDITTPEQALAFFQNAKPPQSPDFMLIASAVLSSLVHTLLRPVFGIAFVLLYFDSRADLNDQAEELPSSEIRS